MSVLQRMARSLLAEDLIRLHTLEEANAEKDANLIHLQERMVELEMALEDVGWLRLIGDSEREFSREALRTINRLARIYWLKNPLIRRAVATQTNYVFGQGINVEARHPLVDEVVQDFLDDSKNQAELTSHQARLIKETELQCFANLFFVFFPNRSTGAVRVRTINPDEIEDIITNPDDAKDPWFYRRVWSVTLFDVTTGRKGSKQQTAYYPDWRYNPAEKPARIGDAPVQWDTPIYHIRVNALSDMKFGVSEIYAAFDWAKAYKEFLENWATIVKSYAMFAWQLTTTGGQKGVSGAKAKLGTTLSTGQETNPPAAPGSMFMSGLGTKLEPVRTAGATTSADDGRRLMLMVSSVTGIFEHYLTGDPSTGNLATATAMELPMLIQFRQRQQFWADVLHDILQYVVDWSGRAPSGKLRGRITTNIYGEQIVELGNDIDNEDPELRDKPIDRHIEVKFPDILQKDMAQRVAAIVQATTLNGQAPAGTFPKLRDVTRMLLVALGEDDVDELLEQMFPEDEQTAEAPGTAPATPEEALRQATAFLREAVRELATANETAAQTD